MRKIAPILFLLLLCLNARADSLSWEDLQEGDLVFVAPATANHITAVTQSAGGAAIDHVAIFHLIGGEVPCVLEAVPKQGVVITPIDTLLSRERGATLIIGRVTVTCDIAASVRNALNNVGRDYDTLYLPDNDEIYCSELVQQSYVDSDGKLIFKPIGMTFRNSEGTIPPYWQDLYRTHGMAVPEGHPGSNPAELSQRTQVKIKGFLYTSED